MTREQIENAVKSKGYSYFENGDYNFNLVAIRKTDDDLVTNKFDDYITLSYKVDGQWQFKEWQITTDPGTTYMKKLLNPLGTARLKPGQYKSSHALGMHQGKYEALCQVRALEVYRDKNKDMKYDETSTSSGLYGINIHHAGADSGTVDSWSAGCQVFKRIKDFNEFLAIIKKGFKASGAKGITLTLIETKDI